MTCTGNEAILEGVKISGSAEDLELDSDTSEDCKEECTSRIGECGSWSFDKSEGICYLHTVDSCCGQFGKREDISGKESYTTFCFAFTLRNAVIHLQPN